jgi:hypothetical protein
MDILGAPEQFGEWQGEKAGNFRAGPVMADGAFAKLRVCWTNCRGIPSEFNRLITSPLPLGRACSCHYRPDAAPATGAPETRPCARYKAMTQKPKKRSIEGTADVDGFALHWTIKREPQFRDDWGYGGLTFSVTAAEGKYRELVLEYPFPEAQPNSPKFIPQRPKIVPEHIAADIRLAMEAGWDPFSRGRPFIFQVPMDVALHPSRKA